MKFKSLSNSKLLLTTNVVTAVLLSLILIRESYPQRFLKKLQSKFSSYAVMKISQEDLSKMNNTFVPSFVDYTKGETGAVFKILVIGNSLTHHEINENIGWTHISGMAASSINSDYVHLLLARISNKLPNRKVIMRTSNFANFERNPNTLSQSTLDSLTNFKPDIIILQLGENVSKQQLPLFQKNM